MRLYYLNNKTGLASIGTNDVGKYYEFLHSNEGERLYGTNNLALNIYEASLGIADLVLPTDIPILSTLAVKLLSGDNVFISIDGSNYDFKLSGDNDFTHIQTNSIAIADILIKSEGSSSVLILLGGETSVSAFEIINFVVGNINTGTLSAEGGWGTIPISTSTLKYGTTIAMLNTVTSSVYTSFHRLVMTGLEVGVTYYAQAISVSKDGNIAYSDIETFVVPNTIVENIETEINIYTDSEAISVSEMLAYASLLTEIISSPDYYNQDISILTNSSEISVSNGTALASIGTEIVWSTK